MTPAEQLLARLQRRADLLTPDLRAAMLKAIRDLQRSLDDPRVAAWLAEGNVQALLDGPLSEARIRAALAEAHRVLRDGAEAAARAFTDDLKLAAPIAFNLANAEILAAVASLHLRAFGLYTDALREGIRTYVEDTLRTGRPPARIVADLKGAVGLSPSQAQAVANFRRMLEEGDATALHRALLDRRFDGTIRRAFAGEGLTPEQVDRMVAAYARKTVAYHADTVARTVALSAQRLGQHLAWQSAIARGDLSGEDVTKRWSGVLDTRERDSHLAIEGETVRFFDRFSNGLMYPGDLNGEPAEVFNCRCVVIYERHGRTKRGAAAFGVTADQLRGVRIGPAVQGAS